MYLSMDILEAEYFLLSSFLINGYLFLFLCVLSTSTLYPDRNPSGAKDLRGLPFLLPVLSQ